jgi:Tol biopolymer transport system component
LLLSGLLLAPGCGGASPGQWKIVFPGFRDGEWGIYVVGRAGGAPMRIGGSSEPAFAAPPVPSPDGRRLILPAVTSADRLVVMNADGSGREDLGEGDPSGAVWSPDGRRIAFLRPYGGLSVIGADGKGERRLTGSDEDSSPAWSPDGKRLAFVRTSFAATAVMLVDPDGRHFHVLRRLEGDLEQLHWARDGRSLTFLEHSGGSYARGDLVTLALAGGRLLRRVPRVNAQYFGIAWSPDGRRLAYVRGNFRLVMMNADGSGRRSLGDGWGPAWAPDGRTIAYVADGPLGAYELRSIRRDGTGMRRLTRDYPDGVEPEAPVWLRGRFRPAPSPYRLVVSLRPDGAVLRMPYPVAVLAASGSRAALVSPERIWAPTRTSMPPLVVWDAHSGRTQRLALPGCHQPESVALLAARVAFDCPWGHAETFGRAVRVLPLGGERGLELADGVAGGGLVGRLPGRVAGRGDLLVFATYLFDDEAAPRRARLWRLAGRRMALVVRAADAGEPAAVDGGRLLVERPDGRVALLRPGGPVLGRVVPWGPAASRASLGILERPSAGLAGRNLVVLRGGRLLEYDASSFRLRRVLRVDRRSRLAGVSDGLVAWAAGTDIHLLRLRDGRQATIRTTSRSAVEAALTSAGLFYALHPRRVPEAQVAPFRADPATVVFLRRAALPLKP